MKSAIVLACSLLLFGSVACAANSPEAFGTRARVAYLYSRGQGTDIFKNVKSFANPSTGIYCISPSVALNYAQVFPLVTVEFANSTGTAMFAYWENGAFDCPTGALEVRTFNGSGNRSSGVAFDFVIE